MEVHRARRSRRVAAQLHKRQGRVLQLASEAREIGEGDDQGRGREGRRLGDENETGEAQGKRADHYRRQGSRGGAQPGLHPAQVRSHPESRQANGPEGDQDSERVVPGVDGRQIEDREADPQARVAVTPSLEVEARHRYEGYGEVRLRQHSTEERQDGITDEVRQGRKYQGGEQQLTEDGALTRPAPIAGDVADRGGRDPGRRNDVVLSIQNDREHRDAKTREDERPRLEGVLDRRRGQPEPHSGQSVPTCCTGPSRSNSESPTTQARTSPPRRRTISSASTTSF